MLSEPWNLYVFRHSAITEKSQILKEHALRDLARWTMSSKLPHVYIHYFGNESSKSLLELKGIISKENRDTQNIQTPISCPNCQEPNKPKSGNFLIVQWYCPMMFIVRLLKRSKKMMDYFEKTSYFPNGDGNSAPATVPAALGSVSAFGSSVIMNCVNVCGLTNFAANCNFPSTACPKLNL